MPARSSSSAMAVPNDPAPTTEARRGAWPSWRREGAIAPGRYRALGVLVQRAVAALGRRETAALGGDRSALDAVRVVDDHVDVALLGRVVGDLVHAGRAHPLPGLRHLAGDVGLDPDVVRRVVAGRV